MISNIGVYIKFENIEYTAIVYGAVNFASMAPLKLLNVSTSIEGKQDSTKLIGSRPRKSLWSI